MIMTSASTATSAFAADGVGTADFVGVGGEAPTPPEEEPPHPDLGDGGAWGRWAGLGRRKKKRLVKQEDEEIVAIIEQAAPHLMQHRRTLH